MRLEAVQRLTGIQSAVDLILSYTANFTEQDDLSDVRMRDAVDRRPAIIGEALGRLATLDEAMATTFPEAPQIIALRNVRIHEYGQVDDALIWRLVQQEMPSLLQRVRAEIRRIEGAEG